MMFEAWMGISRSAMPPLIPLPGLGRVWRFAMFTPSTSTRPVSRLTWRTRPVLPLSRPAITLTVSSLRILIFSSCFGAFWCRCGIFFAMLDHLRSQRHDLHESLVAERAGNRPEYACAHRLVQLVDQYGGVLVETDVS